MPEPQGVQPVLDAIDQLHSELESYPPGNERFDWYADPASTTYSMLASLPRKSSSGVPKFVANPDGFCSNRLSMIHGTDAAHLWPAGTSVQLEVMTATE